LNEPDVTLTDYALAVLCALFAVLLQRGSAHGSGLRPWFVGFFAGASAASLLGGVFHGHFENEFTTPGRQLWTAALLAIGAAAFAGEGLAARLAFTQATARWITRVAALKLALYAGFVALEPRPFRAAVLDYLPAALFLLTALGLAWRRAPRAGAGLAAAGLSITLAAAGIQQLRISPHPIYLDHNALYHVVQAAGFALLYAGARPLCGAIAAREPGAHAA
jgi:hypothetical protein